MNPLPDERALQTPEEEEFVQSLIALDEAISRSGSASTGSSNSLSNGDSERLGKSVRCMKLLRQMGHLRRNSDSSLSGERTATPVSPLFSDAADSEKRFPLQLGRFKLHGELGQGAYGAVFLAHDPEMSRFVALKIPHPQVFSRADLQARFKQEARAAGVLDHPNIVPVFETGSIGPILYLASAYSPGINLQVWLENQSLPIEHCQAASVIAKLAEAVHHAHERGVFHRDLKPANVILQRSRPVAESAEDTAFADRDALIREISALELSDLTPRITDFGLAKTLGRSSLATMSGAILGTPS